jgi:hypothetical protein
MKMKTGRLYKLAKFLDNLPEENFDFGVVIDIMGDPTKDIHSCGTVGCAIGWTPRVFPKLVEYNVMLQAVQPIGGNKVGDDFVSLGSQLFNICRSESSLLFSTITACPWNKDTNLEGISAIHATPKNVAQSIRNFVKWKRLL